jgi:hypothetical protein
MLISEWHRYELYRTDRGIVLWWGVFLRRIVLGLTGRGVHIVFVKENLTFTGEDSPMSNRLLSVMGAFAHYAKFGIMRSHSLEVAL